MAITRRVYQFQLENIMGPNLLGTISDLTTLAAADATIIVDIVSFAQSFNGGYSLFQEFSDFNRRQIVINNIGGTLTIANNRTIYNPFNTTGTTDITWTDSISGTDLNFDIDSVGIAQSVFLTATVTIQT